MTAPRLAAFLVFAASSVACYNPNIQDGKLICAAGNACPDGLHCVNGLCYHKDGGMAEHAPVCTSATPDASTCARAAATGDACNPVCESGCSCGWCGVSNGLATCLTGTPGTKSVGDVCDPAKGADCAPGLYCFGECGTGRCYKYCESNADCASGTICGVTAVNGSRRFTLCRLPQQSCNPIASTGSGCAAPFACYPVGTATECDCPGTAVTGTPCTSALECAAGYTCIGLASGTTCQKTCNSGSDCSSGVCTNNGTTYGYCAP